MTSTNLAIGATRSVCGAQLPRRAVVATGGAFGDLVLAGGAQGAFLGPRGRLLFLLEGDGVRRKTANATRFASARVNEVGAVAADHRGGVGGHVGGARGWQRGGHGAHGGGQRWQEAGERRGGHRWRESGPRSKGNGVRVWWWWGNARAAG